MAKEITFRKFVKEDLPRISEFRKAYFSYADNRSHEPIYYQWKCLDNPVLPGEMWLAEDGETLAAIKSITPKRMSVQGTEIIGAEMGDSFTRPDYQKRGIFTAISKAIRESILDKGVSLIYTTPAQTSLSLHGYLKYLNHFVVPFRLQRMIKPVNLRSVLGAKLHSNNLAAFLSPMAGLTSRAWLKFGTRGSAGRGISVSLEQTVPPDIDSLWDQVSNNYDVILVRNKDYLHWRYITNPDTYSFLVARDRGEAILGYIVTKISSYGDKLTGSVVDFLTVEDNPNVFKRLLASALEEHFRLKVDYVQAWGIKGSFYHRILLRSGFLPRGDMQLACYGNKIGTKVLDKKLKWHFTMGDSDGI